jgi:hypothetical protein
MKVNFDNNKQITAELFISFNTLFSNRANISFLPHLEMIWHIHENCETEAWTLKGRTSGGLPVMGVLESH